MVAMPYIVVIFVLDILSIPLFSLTSTVLLLRLSFVQRVFPKWLSTRPKVALVALALFVTSLALAARILAGRLVFPVFAWAGFANSLVIVYRFLNKRCFLRVPQTLHRVLIALLSVVMTAAAIVAVQVVVTVLFVIR